jgi:hypothetical protein
MVIIRTPFKKRYDARQHAHRFPGTPALPGNFWEVEEMSACQNKAERVV